MHKEQILVISLDNKFGQGEDFQIVEDYDQAIVIGVFDGLGGRSLGTAEEKGGRIASRKAAGITKDILTESQGNLDQDRALEIKGKTCQILKEFAEKNLPVSRIRGKLVSKRLCSTIGVASLFKKLTDDQKHLVQIAWMGDSRVYYLQPHQGLQQLTQDDLKESKDAYEVIYQDLPMSKFLTADPDTDWEINYKAFEFPKEGFILACTDGCFQYLPAPWEFEKLLLKTLIESNSMEEWQNLLTNFYKNNKYDDVTLLLCSLGKDQLEFKDFHTAYKPRLEHLYTNYYIHNKSSSDELKKMWGQYRNNYENLLEKAKFEDFAYPKEVKANDVYFYNLEEKTDPIENFEEESSSYLKEEKTEPIENFEEESSSYLREEKTEPIENFEEEFSSYLREEKTDPIENFEEESSSYLREEKTEPIENFEEESSSYLREEKTEPIENFEEESSSYLKEEKTEPIENFEEESSSYLREKKTDPIENFEEESSSYLREEKTDPIENFEEESSSYLREEKTEPIENFEEESSSCLREEKTEPIENLEEEFSSYLREEKTEPIENLEEESSNYLREEKNEPIENFEEESSSYLREKKTDPIENFEEESSSYLREEKTEPIENFEEESSSYLRENEAQNQEKLVEKGLFNKKGGEEIFRQNEIKEDDTKPSL